jgi:MtN3 and saliva related transmembrane protein
MEPVTIFATLAVLLTVAYSIPQAIKVYLSSVPKAVSGITTTSMVFSSLAMLMYGYFSKNETVSTPYAFLFIFNVFILLIITQKAGVNRKRIFFVGLLQLALLAGVLIYSKNLLAFYGGFLSAFMLLPQGFKMIRQREATGVSGLSYLLLALASLCWIAYGHLTENTLLILPNLVIFPTATMVYINVIKYRSVNFWYQNIKATNRIH